MAFHQKLLLVVTLIIYIDITPSLQQAQNKINPVDFAALSAIKTSLRDIRGTNFLSTWDFTSPDPCSTFSGVTCSFDRVTTLSLGTGLTGSLGLAGSLSPCIANLTELTQLILFPGLVAGVVPFQLGQLSNLRVLSLTNNRLTGPIPSSLSSLRNLHTLDLSFNQLFGSIPTGLTELPELKILILSSNRLSGELPNSTEWTQLLHLDIKENELEGELPPTLPSSLRYLSLSRNRKMWGPLNVLEKLMNLVFLDLSMNMFNGTIPSSLFRPSLSSMFLQRNNLSGGLPPSLIVGPTFTLIGDGGFVTSYGEGSIVDLSHNGLSGELTDVLADVETLFFNNNRLTGTVPKAYIDGVSDGKTKTLYLQHNFLTGFPLDNGVELPDTVSLCLSYNCIMKPPVGGLTGCPASAGWQISRPTSQCSVFTHALIN
ncbi:hypothetical protein ACFE04_000673 [Oxalis oulophora]